ncbi:hypothetical protein EXIGLDRAFT_723707 [Exidia glandulosa HHB12029]|uniref:F-box domain-containing protein n=1 Tax=Exidia glandulosa HHB12029 TaxID=1314781 RepID=A0A165EPT2_EXIGL|nr:hypothetical protein EXIGLDRAFT_723707 [Exidia glandulosa HHB12029]
MEHELSSLVLSVFQQTLALAGQTTVDIVAQSVAAVQRCVTAALAPELRIGNARLAATRRLPEEVLCMIWRLLCVEDRVKVSHVCSSWRSLALNTHRLWVELDFHSAVHDSDCCCSLCEHFKDDDGIRTWTPPSVTNLGICCNVLARSESLPLVVHMEFPLDRTPIKELLNIVSSLRPHCHRVEGIFFGVPRAKDLTDFFSIMSSPLPNLRTLHCMATESWLQHSRPIILPALPSAETVLIGTAALDYTSLQLPSLRRLHCRVDDEHHILRILNGCPYLEILSLEVETFKLAASQALFASIRSRTSRLRQVVLLGVKAAIEHSLLAMFHHATLQSLAIHYCDFDHPPADFMIFRDLQGTIDVVFSEEEGADCTEDRISATDSSGCCRALQSLFVVGSLASLWGQLSHGTVTTLTLPVNVWPCIQRVATVLPCVRSVTFLFDSFVQVGQHLFEVLDEPYPLPGLEHLRLVCSKDRNRLFDRSLATVADIAIAISSLKGSIPVETLTVENVDLDGDREELASLAHELRI